MSRDAFHTKMRIMEEMVGDMGRILDKLLSEIISVFQSRNLSKSQLKQWIEEEKAVDELDFKVEHSCIEMIALHQPMGIDLREIVSTIKIASDLERIGDHIRKICRKVHKVVRLEAFENFSELAEMTILLRQMVDQIVVAYQEKNVKLAKDTLRIDQQINELQRSLFQKYIQKMQDHPENKVISSEIYLLFVTRFLERIGDHVENVGEQVIYMVTGNLTILRP